MSRGVASGFSTALQAGHVDVFPLLELGFASGTQYLCGLAHDVVWSGNTYSAALGVMEIDTVQETDGSYQGLKVKLAGVTATSVALVLTENPQGRPITLRLAVLDGAGTLQVDTNVWSGYMDTMSSVPEGEGDVVMLTAEHKMATWDRPRIKRYTDAQQQAEFPGDTGLRYIAQMEEVTLVWPNEKYFQQ